MGGLWCEARREAYGMSLVEVSPGRGSLMGGLWEASCGGLLAGDMIHKCYSHMYTGRIHEIDIYSLDHKYQSHVLFMVRPIDPDHDFWL